VTEERFEIVIYQDDHGKAHFSDWIKSLDRSVRNRVFARLDRVENGNFGDWKSIANGIGEIRFKFGSGYRLYFGRDGKRLVILLCAGDKKSQQKDIKLAKELWIDYLSRREI
jgi:putative addiction module killer protein